VRNVPLSKSPGLIPLAIHQLQSQYHSRSRCSRQMHPADNLDDDAHRLEMGAYKKYTNRLHFLDLRRRRIRKLPPGRGLQFQFYHQYPVLNLIFI